MENFKKHISLCFERIERKLSIGSIENWDTNDFQILSDSIHKETGTLLSISTLKRLSGRINYRSKPKRSSQDTLAKYIGYDNWRMFLLEMEPVNFIETQRKEKSWKRFIYVVPFLLVILAISIFHFFENRTTIYDPSDFTFSVKSVTTGLPNSVIFKYDASMIGEKDKVEIQQDWDERKRVIVDKNDSISTSIYYHPGFFKSKLVVNDSIIKEKTVFIPSNDWMATIETDSLPIYLNNEDFRIDGELSVRTESLKKYGKDPFESKTLIGFYQIRDFGGVYTDDFELTALLKNNFKSGNTPCQGAQVTIVSEEGPIVVPICNKGCISDISLFAFGERVDGKKNDLENFGVDYTDYVQLKCVSKDQELVIFVNEEPAYSFKVPNPKSKIIGVCIFFEGTGSIKDIKLTGNAREVYSFGL